MTQFSTRDLPWWKVGTVIDHAVTAEEAVKLGGLDFEMLTQPAGYRNTKGNWCRAGDRVALVREDTGEVFQFATKEYTPVPYAEAFQFMDSINPNIVAAGALRGGRQGFIVTELPNRDDLTPVLRGKPDPHKLYVVLRTSQDMSRGVEIILTTLRSRCMNQLTMRGFGRNSQQMWSIRHTRNVRVRMEQARDVLGHVEAYEDEWNSLVGRLANTDVSIEEAGEVLTQVLPDRPRRDEQIDAIISAMSLETNGFSGTGWGLVNAVDEYFEYLRSDRGRTVESRFTDGIDGMAHRMTNRTVAALLS